MVKYRHLSRNSAHRQALLRSLVTSLVKHESIQTSYAKAKEAQRLAEKLITLAKRNNEETRRKAYAILYEPTQLFPKVMGELRRRYQDRPGGYTRVLRTMPKSTYDQGDSAILELVDGPKDMRFHMTAAAVARDQRLRLKSTPLTEKNRLKVTRYRKDGPEVFKEMVVKMRRLGLSRRKHGVLGTRQPRMKQGDPNFYVEELVELKDNERDDEEWEDVEDGEEIGDKEMDDMAKEDEKEMKENKKGRWRLWS